MTYYFKGGSRYNAANPKVWVSLMLGGFPDADYLLTDWVNLDDKGHETAQDPFWRMGGSVGGAKELEIGLWEDFRIKFETTGITYWDGDSWENLLTGGTHTHDGETLQLDGINSDGGAFSFSTTGAITFNQNLNLIPAIGNAIGLTLESSEDAVLTLIGDTNNDDETKNAWASFFQDGEARWLHIGVGKGIGDNNAFIQTYDNLEFLTGTIGAGVLKMNLSTTALTMSVPIAMGSNNITLGDGQTVDGVDISTLPALIAANTTQTEVETIIIAELVDGESIDNRIDALILPISITNMPTAVNNWKLFCTNGAGVMTEIATGAADTVLTGNGVAAAPSFQAAGGADNLGDHTATQTLNLAGNLIDNVSHIQSDGIIYLAPQNDTDDEFVISSTVGSIRMWQEGATTSAEAGIIGYGTGASALPLKSLYANALFDDDGNLGSYSHVDDLQLLREMTEYRREKPMSPDFPDRKQKVWDMNTVPWIKAHSDVNAMPNDSNEKRYSVGMGAANGYFLSVLKKLVEEIDILKLRILDLEKP